MAILFPGESHTDTRSSSRNAVYSELSASVPLTSLTTPRYLQYLTMSSLPGQSVWRYEKKTTVMICEHQSGEHENRRGLTRLTKPSSPLGSCCYSRVEILLGALSSSVKDYLWHNIVWANCRPPLVSKEVREAQS